MVGRSVLSLGLLLAAAASAMAAVHHPTGASAPLAAAPASGIKAKPAAPVKLVDINSASLQQLEALPGLSKADAQRIVAGRPYLSKADLVSSKVLPAGVYVAIKGRIVAKQDLAHPPAAKARP